MRAKSSEWDDLEPEAKWRDRIADPAAAARQIAADKRLIAALSQPKIDLEELHAALKDEACPDRIVCNGFPALHVAIGARDGKALGLLLRFGAKTGDLDEEGATALDYAYRLGFKDGIRQLKQVDAPTRRAGGQDVAANDEDGPSYRHRINRFLRDVVEKGTAGQVVQAIALGAQVNDAGAKIPALHLAIAQCDAEKVTALLDAGADVFSRGEKGGDVIDALWFASQHKLGTPPWRDIFDALHAHGYANLFVKPPEEMTPDDLRRKLPLGATNAPSLMHYLVLTGQVDFVLDVLKKHPEQALTAAELREESKYYKGDTLLHCFYRQNALSRIFTAAVWQGRVEEMLSLKPEVEGSIMMKGKVDFEAAAADVRAVRLQQLQQKAGGKLRLRTKKPTPKG